MLTWILFLKFLDDMERIEEERAELAGSTYHGILEAPYRWRDWAAAADGITGPDLLAFLVAEWAERPDGTRGAGLFAYLRSLRDGSDGRGARRDVIATVFQGFTNRMESGYLLRDVVNLIDGIHFDSSEEIHTLGRLYETLLREMRDSAGDSGEFYTPRPVVRFMVEAIDPRLGETILDPACGTGGFLVETYRHLEKQTDTVEKREILQEHSILVVEAKSLPFLLAQMNLLLHGHRAPRIDPGNALRFRLTEIGEESAHQRHPHQPTLRRRGGGGHPQQLPGGSANLRDCGPVPAAHHAAVETGWAGQSRRRGAERHAVRGRHLRPDQGQPP